MLRGVGAVCCGGRGMGSAVKIRMRAIAHQLRCEGGWPGGGLGRGFATVYSS